MKSRKEVCIKRLIWCRVLSVALFGALIFLYACIVYMPFGCFCTCNQFLWEKTMSVDMWLECQSGNLWNILTRSACTIPALYVVYSYVLMVLEFIIARCLPLPHLERSAALDDHPNCYPVDLHGVDFAEFAACTRHEDLEFAATFAQDNHKIAEYTSYMSDYVEYLVGSGSKAKDFYKAHCHPGGPDSAHSPTDVSSMIGSLRYEVIIAQRHTYIMEDLHHGVTLRGWSRESLERRLEWEYFESSRLPYRLVLKIAPFLPVVVTWYWIFFCIRVAKRYEFKFTMRPAWKDDWRFIYRYARARWKERGNLVPSQKCEM